MFFYIRLCCVHVVLGFGLIKHGLKTEKSSLFIVTYYIIFCKDTIILFFMQSLARLFV
jgi:hypothetical protein